jgi:hypothetical protein
LREGLVSDPHRLRRVLAAEEAGGADGLEADARVLVVRLHLQQRQDVRDPVAPVAKHAGRRGAGVRVGGTEHSLE